MSAKLIGNLVIDTSKCNARFYRHPAPVPGQDFKPAGLCQRAFFMVTMICHAPVMSSHYHAPILKCFTSKGRDTCPQSDLRAFSMWLQYVLACACL
ncbi:hypothetical protein ACO0LD_30080 [Undibacterium sp. Ji83W]|uniref:hypothetical protein n=1 Tax=Undibacterium sp. Ji83W TaxID=3413043 RepID=UPI003BF259AB